MKLPTKVIENILLGIESDPNFYNKEEKFKQKVLKTAIELWMFIYNRQQEDKSCHNLQFYTKIFRNEFGKFKLKSKPNVYKYAKFIYLLTNSDLIEHTGYSYKSKEHPELYKSFSKGYRIKDGFLDYSNLTEIEVDFDKIFNNTQNKSHWIEKYPEQSNLIEDSYNTTIDIDGLLTWMNSNKGIELKPIVENGKIKRRFLDDERIFNYIYLSLKVNIKKQWFKLSNEGRFYSSISNLPYIVIDGFTKGCKYSVDGGFIRLYGEKVESIDISNCQPLLLTTLIPLHNQYKKDVEDGIFYDKVANVLGIKRNVFKMLSYRFIFFNNNPLNTGKIKSAMDNLYPGLINDINNLKVNMEISKELQVIESNIFVKVIGKLPAHKLLRHDQVLFHKKDAKLIRNMVGAEFNKLKIKIKLK